MKKFMKAIKDVTSFIGTNSGIQRRSGNERREQIKKVPKIESDRFYKPFGNQNSGI